MPREQRNSSQDMQGESTRYAFIEPEVSCSTNLMHIARRLGKKLKVEVVDVNGFVEGQPQIVVVFLNSMSTEGFLESLIDAPERIRGIKHLFIEQFGHYLPENLSEHFKPVQIDMDYSSEIPPCISLKELALTISQDIRNECLKSKEHKIMKEIGDLTQTELYKPKKVMSEVKKFLFRKQLEKYGTLDEVFKELQK